jgi:hypothetical protein
MHQNCFFHTSPAPRLQFIGNIGILTKNIKNAWFFNPGYHFWQKFHVLDMPKRMKAGGSGFSDFADRFFHNKIASLKTTF